MIKLVVDDDDAHTFTVNHWLVLAAYMHALFCFQKKYIDQLFAVIQYKVLHNEVSTYWSVCADLLY